MASPPGPVEDKPEEISFSCFFSPLSLISLLCKSLTAAGGFFFYSRLNIVEKSKVKSCSQL